MLPIFRKTIIPCLLFINLYSYGQVKYDEGNVYIGGLTLLQDRKDSTIYYYLPNYPRLSKKEDGTLEFLFLKYTTERSDEKSGGIFHALVDFRLPDSLLKIITKELQKITTGARIAGPVPLMQPKNNGGDNEIPKFAIISGILSSKNGKDALTRSEIKSGFAPLTPGSKAAIAAVLSPNGATLLWNSFTGPTSDVSVSISGYYEAVVKAYNAKVDVSMDVFYTHFSKISSKQQGFSKTQIRNEVDKMIKAGEFKIEVFDRNKKSVLDDPDEKASKESAMASILSTITTKLTDLIFDAEKGWSKEPQGVDPSLGFVDQGKQERVGTVADLTESFIDIMGAMNGNKSRSNKNPEYRTDNQYILKDIKRIKSNRFQLNLNEETIIKVPFSTAGNLGGVYKQLHGDKRYFRLIEMNDPDYEERTIPFQIDDSLVSDFNALVNSVTVNFRKKYSNGQTDKLTSITFNKNDLLKDAIPIKEITYKRLGLPDVNEFSTYEYQVTWNLKGEPKPYRIPSDPSKWIVSHDAGVVLTLSSILVKSTIGLEIDFSQFKDEDISTLAISFFSDVMGQKKQVRQVILRPTDVEPRTFITIYHDVGSPIVYKGTWFSKSKGTAPLSPAIVETENYMLFSPPAPDKFTKGQ